MAALYFEELLFHGLALPQNLRLFLEQVVDLVAQISDFEFEFAFFEGEAVRKSAEFAFDVLAHARFPLCADLLLFEVLLFSDGQHGALLIVDDAVLFLANALQFLVFFDQDHDLLLKVLLLRRQLLRVALLLLFQHLVQLAVFREQQLHFLLIVHLLLLRTTIFALVVAVCQHLLLMRRIILSGACTSCCRAFLLYFFFSVS